MNPLEELKSEVADLFQRREASGMHGMSLKSYYIWTAQIARKLEEYVGLLEAGLADRPVVWAIQQIETKELSKKGGSVNLYKSEEAAEKAIRSDFFWPCELQAVIYTGRPINETA